MCTARQNGFSRYVSSEEERPRSDTFVRIPLTSTVLPKPIALAYLLSILYNVSFFTQLSIFPYTVKALGISDSEFGFMQTIFGVLQMIGGPAYGCLTRRFGIKQSLLLCYASIIISSLLKFMATSKTVAYLSIMPCTFMHGQQAHQTLLSVFTSPGKERTNAFGRMGITFGIGFIGVPILSTISSKLFGSNSALITASMVAALAMFVSTKCLQLPTDIQEGTAEARGENSENTTDERRMDWKTIKQLAGRPGVLKTVSRKSALLMPMMLVFSIMQVHLINEFQISQEINSFLQIFTGFLIMIVNGFAIIWLRKHFAEKELILFGAVACLIANLLLSQLRELWVMFITTPFIALGMSLVGTVSDSLLTSAVLPNEQALILGAANALNSVVRTFGPTLAGIMLDKYGFPVFGYIGTVICFISLVTDYSTILNTIQRKPKNKSF